MNIYTNTTAPRTWISTSAAHASIMEKSKTTTAAPPQIVEDIDSACLRALAAGDRSALASLVERWQTRLINFFYRSTGNRADAEDLAQETFVELYRAAPRYTAQGTFNAFIFTLARRRLIDSYRKSARRPLEFIDPTDYVMQQQAEETNATREIEEAFHLALAGLPDNQRNAILMLQQQGLSYEEIAEALEASLSAVKTWIHRARTHLRIQLKDFYENN
jgi:RNA polymerase sigma-70 factor, ECF subfamily